MKIRIAKTGDERSIAAVIIDTWKVAYRRILPDDFLDSLTTEKHEELFRKNIAERQETIFVLENEKNDIVGVISGGKDRAGICDCELVAIYILPAYQKLGYGKQLFKALIDDYKQKQYQSMIIWAFKDNRDREFYSKLGGIVHEERSISFAGTDYAIVGYIWQDIHTISI